MEKERSIATLTIESTMLCCNLVNTVYAWPGFDQPADRVENIHEYLQEYEDVVAWCQKLGLFGTSQLNGLRALSRAHPIRARQALGQIRQARQEMYDLISAIAAGASSSVAKALERLNPSITEAMTRYHINYSGGGFVLQPAEKINLLTPLHMALQSLSGMLLTKDPARIKECPKCGWVFLDETKNGSRRWCSPVECGAQDKMKRYNAKKKKNQDK